MKYVISETEIYKSNSKIICLTIEVDGIRAEIRVFSESNEKLSKAEIKEHAVKNAKSQIEGLSESLEQLKIFDGAPKSHAKGISFCEGKLMALKEFVRVNTPGKVKEANGEYDE